MWQIINVEPAYGVCSICRSHECGIVDGQHQWIHTEALDDTRENIVIGHKCVKLFAENLGISKQVVEKVVEVQPSDEQVLKFIKKVVEHPIGVVGVGYELSNSMEPNFTAASAISILEHHEESKDTPSTGTKSNPRKRVK